ncbi:PAS domain S-box protein [Caenispirillum salinarum]|uniref:PAS domain S-box protein n=1 Tax=Caenispirillum salinarum TaxID=859058 RepID=UPI00384D9472
MNAVRHISLPMAVGLAVVLTAVAAVSLYTAGQYVAGRERIAARLAEEGERRAASLAASVAPYVQAYAVNEYATLVGNEMGSENIKAIVVRDDNMGGIVDEPAYVVGRVREPSGTVVDYDPADAGHVAVMAECRMIYRADLRPPGAAASVGTLSICMSDTALQAQLATLLQDSALIGLVTTLPIAVIVLLTLHRLVVRPIRHAADVVAERDATGLPSQAIPVRGAREIRALASLINQMVDMTRASRQALEVHHQELLRQKAKVTTSERKLREIIWSTGAGTWEWNVQTGETEFNDRWAEMCGYTLAELEPISIKTWQTLVHPDDAPRSAAALEQVFARKVETYSCECRMRHKDGHWLWIHDKGKVVEWDAEGRPLRVSGTHLDITERKEREATLARILRLNRDILDAAGEGIFGVDDTGTITFINRAACAILGYDCAQLVGRNAHAAFHYQRADGSPYPETECPTCAAFSEGVTTRVENDTFWCRDGSHLTVDFVATPIFDEAEEARGAVVVFRDVTQMREQQARLKKLSQAVEQSPVSVVITDCLGNIEYVNHTFEAVTGYTLDEVKGSNPRFMKSGYTSAEDYQTLWDTILAGETWSGEFHNRRKDGTLFWELATIAPVIGDDGRIDSFLGIKEDITDRKAMEEALRRSNEELEHFAYAASHDLRQPLRMINSYTQLVERRVGDSLPERAKEFMGYVKDGAQRMDQMLVALLEYSRVGRMGEPIAPVDSGELVVEAIRFLAVSVEERGALIDLPEDWPIIHASRNEGVRLFQNLIGNALKYCPPDRRPHITLTARKRPDGTEFAIADNGIGIDPRQAPRLFKVFQRLHQAEEYEGTGVGLAVCRRIMDRHGGRIWLESAGEGHGSTFHVLFPASGAASGS